MNSFTDLCECDLGWESEKDLNWDDFIPSTVPLHMCTVRKKEISNNYIEFLKKHLLLKNWTISELVSFDYIVGLKLYFNILYFMNIYYNILNNNIKQI